MLLILLGVLVLHLIILILLIVSTAASAWTVGGDSSTDLWYKCMTTNGGYHCRPASNADWIQAVQALMILSILFCFFSLIAFLYQLFRLVKGGRFFFTAIFQILILPHILSPPVSRVFVMCAAIIYTVMSPDDGSGAQFGYAYVLAWVAFPLCLVSGLIYIVLRKKE
uniref:Peripheral myelin protein 22a n=1 Tax=Sparus aurata TaxID=8175 RepID=A0A671Z0E2_SPAAU